jgi:3-oxoacyl-[acyl-carrier-protein] synthase III
MSLPVTTKIESLGLYIPEKTLTTEEVMAGCAHRPRWDLERITGIHQRHVADEGEYAIDLALKAARRALSMSRHSADEIDCVICTSISKYNRHEAVIYEPATSALICRELGLKGTRNFDLINACAGMMTGIFTADAYIRSGKAKCALVVSGELNTPIFRAAQREIRLPIDGQFASLTIGDCGAAYIIDGSDTKDVGFHQFDFVTGARHSDLCWSTPSWRTHGGVLLTRAREFQIIGNDNFPRYSKRILAKTGWTLEDVDRGIPHQISVRGIHKSRKAMDRFFGCNVGDERYACVADRYGNTSTTTHAVGFHEEILAGRINDGMRILLIIGASGIVVGHATLTLDDFPSRYRKAFGAGEKPSPDDGESGEKPADAAAK